MCLIIYLLLFYSLCEFEENVRRWTEVSSNILYRHLPSILRYSDQTFSFDLIAEASLPSLQSRYGVLFAAKSVICLPHLQHYLQNSVLKKLMLDLV